MNFAETLRGLLRRWYITFPGLVLAAAVALGAWLAVPPSYERSATQLLIPGELNMPADSNPLLYLGGLSYAADVLVRAVGADNVLDEVKKDHPDVSVEVTRDGTSSGPFILITVTAPTDAEAGAVLDDFVGRTSTMLASIQESQHIAADNRITVVPVAVDDTSTLQQRNRLVATAGAGVAVLVIALLLAGLVDGLSRQRRRRGETDAVETDELVDDVEPRDDDDDELADVADEPYVADDPAGEPTTEMLPASTR